MHIRDTRDGHVFEGELVMTIKAGDPVKDEHLAKFYGVAPGSKNYDRFRAPLSYERLVIQRGEVTDHSFYIIPRYEFYKVIE